MSTYGKVVHSLPMVLPILKATCIQPRSIDFIWTYANRDPRYLFSNLSYQLVYSEVGSLTFRTGYEGDEPMCTVSDLKPLTKYKFKLRIGLTDHVLAGHSEPWSKTFSEVEVLTTDESFLTKVSAQLMRSIAEIDVAKVTSILAEYGKQLSLESRDKNGKTLLMLACQSGSADIVKALLNAGASITATTRSGKTALSIAISYGSLKAAEALLQFDPELVKVPDVGGSTPLMWAVENAAANIRTGVQMVELLLAHGADVNAEDPRGATAFDRLCASSGHVKTAQVLLAAGAKVIYTISKKHNLTSLMSASLNGHKDLVKHLLEKCGCDPAVVTEHGGTAKSFAESAGHRAIVQMIEDRLHSLAEGAPQSQQAHQQQQHSSQSH